MKKTFFDSTASGMVRYFVRPNDDFVLNSLEKVNSDEFLYRILKEDGYERVVFFEVDETNCKVFAYDKLSHLSLLNPDDFRLVNISDAESLKFFYDSVKNKNEKTAAGPAGLTGSLRGKASNVSEVKEYGKREVTRFAQSANFITVFENYVSNALQSKNIKTAIVMQMEMFGRTFHKEMQLASKTSAQFVDIIRKNEKINTKKQNVIVFTTTSKDSFWNLFNNSLLHNLHPWIAEVLREQSNVDRVQRAINKLEEYGCIVLADSIGEDELANLLLRKKIVEKDDRLQNLSFSKVYTLAGMLKDHLLQKKNYFSLIPYRKGREFVRPLNAILENDEVIKEIITISKTLPVKEIVRDYDSEAISLERITKDKRQLVLDIYDEHDILSEFDEMVGMEDIKTQLVKFLNAVEINQKKYKSGKIKKLSYMNLRFVGPAGTGKTTVAKILGRLFCAKNILSNPEPVIKKAGDYSSGGHVDVMKGVMRPDLDSANNGIILIDEFYNFNKGHSSGNLATEALEVIMSAADDYKETLCIIVAGYENEVNETFKFNEGCRGRFPHEIKFRNYSTDELVEIFKRTVVSNGYSEPDAEVLKAIRPIIESEKSVQGKEFGNARFVAEELFPKIEIEYYERAASDDILSVSDVINAYGKFSQKIQNSELVYGDILSEFDEMVGMEDIKTQLVKFLNAVEINQKKYKSGKIKKLSYMNLRFVGPAGTGKTTVAKILGRLFCAKNILSNPEPVIKKAGDYSSGGHVDVMKGVMRPDLDSANNGIILIDEFYNFNKGHSSGNLATEALEVIMSAADDYKETLCIIVAGYENEVNETFKFNEGCRGRFPHEIKFRNYSTDELVEIFKRTVVSNGYSEPDAEVLKAIRPIIESEKSVQGKEFGNARFVAEELFPKIEIEYYERAASDDILSVSDVINAYPTPKISSKKKYSKLPYSVFNELPEAYANKEYSEETINDIIESSILFVTTDKGTGTAFMISPDGYALTCNHVIKGANEIDVRVRIPGRKGGSDSNHKCEVVNAKEDSDIALIKLSTGSDFPYLNLAKKDRQIKRGESYVLAGYPFGKRTAADYTAFYGRISSSDKQVSENGLTQFNINGEGKRGQSGSPIVSLKDGCVIGLLCGSITEGNQQLTEEINYMRPIKYFSEEFLK